MVVIPYVIKMLKNMKNINSCEQLLSQSQKNLAAIYLQVCLLWAELQLDKWLSSRSKVRGLPGTSPKGWV